LRVFEISKNRYFSKKNQKNFCQKKSNISQNLKQKKLLKTENFAPEGATKGSAFGNRTRRVAGADLQRAQISSAG
jgi:hypothetical protein